MSNYCGNRFTSKSKYLPYVPPLVSTINDIVSFVSLIRDQQNNYLFWILLTNESVYRICLCKNVKLRCNHFRPVPQQSPIQYICWHICGTKKILKEVVKLSIASCNPYSHSSLANNHVRIIYSYISPDLSDMILEWCFWLNRSLFCIIGFTCDCWIWCGHYFLCQ